MVQNSTTLDKLDARSISLVYTIAMVFLIVKTAAAILTSIILMIIFDGATVVVLIGLGVMFVTPFISLLEWVLLQPLFGLMYDVKRLRYLTATQVLLMQGGTTATATAQDNNPTAK